MKVVIIKYNAGNIFSVYCALKRVGVNAIITDDKDIIRSADKIIFPGVGEAASTMKYLKEHGLDEVIKNLKQPVLGICIGMQLMCSHSEEGNVDCLGIFDAEVKRFVPQCHADKVPHMGWNSISDIDSSVFNCNVNNEFVYFVHSYYVPLCNETVGCCDYIKPFSAILRKDNFYATQFHIEKSGSVGEMILKGFLDL